jgi:GAF domain-containing protein
MTELTVITTISVALITAVVGPVAIEWVKAKLATSTKKSSVKEAIDLNELVDDQLDQLLDYLECDRIWIAQFHNGGHFYPTGKSIQKFSLFYEKLTPNTPAIQHVFQQIPVSLFPKAFAKLYKDGELSLPDYETHEMYDLEVFYRDYGTKSFYLIAINDLDGHFIGIMGLSFNSKEHKLSKEEWILIRSKAGAIGSLLTSYLYNKK